jgi:hypothetical protein
MRVVWTKWLGTLRSAPLLLLHINAVNEANGGGVDEKGTIKKSKMNVNEDANRLKSISQRSSWGPSYMNDMQLYDIS